MPRRSSSRRHHVKRRPRSRRSSSLTRRRTYHKPRSSSSYRRRSLDRECDFILPSGRRCSRKAVAHLEPCGQKYCTQHCHEVERRSAEHHENYTPIVFRFPQASEGMERRPLEHRETHMPVVHQLPQAPERVYEPMSQFRQRKSVEALENQGYLVARKLNNCFGRCSLNKLFIQNSFKHGHLCGSLSMRVT